MAGTKSPKGFRDSVRIGPLSLFTLIVLICLSVLAVLSATTSQAMYASANKQIAFTTETYANEVQAQNTMATIDGILYTVRNNGVSFDDAKSAIAGIKAAKVEGDRVTMRFTQSSGRTLDITVLLYPNGTYSIEKWEASTPWGVTTSAEQR